MALNMSAAQSGAGGVVFGRSLGGGVGPGNYSDNAYYVPPDPGNSFRDANGRVQYGAANVPRRGATKKSRPRIAGLPAPENPMLTFMKQMMGMPTGRTGSAMMNRNAKSNVNLQWKQNQMQSRNMGRPQQRQQGGLDKVNSYIGPQQHTQTPFWGIPTNTPPSNF